MIINTDYLRETVSFNQEKGGSLGSGKKMAEELDGVFREKNNKKVKYLYFYRNIKYG